MSKSYIVIIRRAWCNEGGHGIEYSSDLIHYETRNGAISHGFRAVDSDDFNIGVIEGGKLISFDWMDKPVGESEDTLAQMKGQKVEGSYYLAECTDCGKMYPSNKLNGGEPLFSGDYGECYCPHCNADDAAIGDCGDTAATAWNYQQDHIDALVEALEKAQGMEAYWKTQCRGITDHCEELQARIAELESRTVTVKLPRPGFITISGERMAVYLKGDVDAAMLAAGIEEAE